MRQALEQIEGVTVDRRSDIFSLGVLLYHMLSDQLPFKGDHEAAIFEFDPERKAGADPPVPARPFPDVRLPIVERALEKKPADRYQAVDEMLAELRHLKRASFSISRVFSRPTGETKKLATKPFTRYHHGSPHFHHGRSKDRRFSAL